MKKTHEKYIEELNELNKMFTNLECLEKYKGASVKIKHKCLDCGHIWKINPTRVLTLGGRCPYCKGKNYVNGRRTNEQYIDELNRVNPNIKPIEPYKRNNGKSKHKCKLCDHVFNGKPNQLLSGYYGCPKCHVNRCFERYKTKYVSF